MTLPSLASLLVLKKEKEKGHYLSNKWSLEEPGSCGSYPKKNCPDFLLLGTIKP